MLLRRCTLGFRTQKRFRCAHIIPQRAAFGAQPVTRHQSERQGADIPRELSPCERHRARCVAPQTTFRNRRSALWVGTRSVRGMVMKMRTAGLSFQRSREGPVGGRRCPRSCMRPSPSRFASTSVSTHRFLIRSVKPSHWPLSSHPFGVVATGNGVYMCTKFLAMACAGRYAPEHRFHRSPSRVHVPNSRSSASSRPSFNNAKW